MQREGENGPIFFTVPLFYSSMLLFYASIGASLKAMFLV
jgi:hypothetical protein